MVSRFKRENSPSRKTASHYKPIPCSLYILMLDTSEWFYVQIRCFIHSIVVHYKMTFENTSLSNFVVKRGSRFHSGSCTSATNQKTTMSKYYA
jgi:hypothetical protein